MHLQKDRLKLIISHLLPTPSFSFSLFILLLYLLRFQMIKFLVHSSLNGTFDRDGQLLMATFLKILYMRA